MRVAIIGYGKMGKLIRSLALSEGHDIVLVVDPMATENEVTSKHLEAQSFGDVDVAIDFRSRLRSSITCDFIAR